MNFEFFNNILDRFLIWASAQPRFIDDGWNFDPELVPYDLFLQFFTSDDNHLSQIYNSESPMRKVLEFDDVFVYKAKIKKFQDTNPEDEYEFINIDQLLDTCMNPGLAAEGRQVEDPE